MLHNFRTKKDEQKLLLESYRRSPILGFYFGQMLLVSGLNSLYVCMFLFVHVVVNQQRLTFRGEQLKDEDLLSDYGVKNESVIWLAQRRPGVYDNPLNEDVGMVD